MKVLLTGASGFIGGNVLRKLVADGHDVVCPVRKPLDALRQDGPVGPGNVMTLAADLRKMPDLNLRLTGAGPYNAIINCASEAQVAQSLVVPRDHVEANVAIITNVLQFARLNNIGRVIHLSTNEVNDIKTPYGASKAAQESICTAWREAYDVPVSVLRTRSVFGPGQQPTKFIPTVVRSIQNDEVIKIVGGVNASRHWHPVAHLCDDIMLLLDDYRKPALRASSSEEEVPHMKLISLAEEVLQKPATLQFVRDDGRYAADEPPMDSVQVSGWRENHQIISLWQELESTIKNLAE